MMEYTSTTNKPKAVVLLSGGLDSATLLAIARQNFDCYTLSIDYGQKHRAELLAAEKIAEQLGAIEHVCMPLPIQYLLRSALTQKDLAVPKAGESTGIPITYVPARNTIMLSLALAWAESIGAYHIFYGANALDYSGYPDCRPDYVSAFNTLAHLATKTGVEGNTIQILAPMVDWTKAQIIQKGITLGVDYAQTVSCYQASEEGLACGVCDACNLRRQGFIKACIDDPTRYQG